MGTTPDETVEELSREIQRLGKYLKVRVLPDGSVAALGDLMFTRAIYLGCTPWGYARRFCFSDKNKANTQFDLLSSEDDEPAGYIARR